MNALRDESFYYQYEQNGGTVEMPKEVFWELYNDSKEEIERLKNIISGLENYLHRKIEWSDSVSKSVPYIYVNEKLQELKGSDKE